MLLLRTPQPRSRKAARTIGRTATRPLTTFGRGSGDHDRLGGASVGPARCRRWAIPRGTRRTPRGVRTDPSVPGRQRPSRPPRDEPSSHPTRLPPAIIRKGERTRYLRALRRADADDPSPLGELIARAIIDTLMRFIVPAVAGPARLVPLAALADRQISARALRAAAERGRLRAQRDERGQWRSTRNWVDEYRASRYKRGGSLSKNEATFSG